MVQKTNPDHSLLQPAADAIEYTRFFADNNALNTRFTSILRMNATFPYIMPAASLPTTPSIGLWMPESETITEF